MYQLRPYQNEAVQAVIGHFRQQRQPAVLVLPTGAGKSLVIAELARLARGRVLVLAHVKELVEQNYLKFAAFENSGGIYSAGLKRKDRHHKVLFGSIQSVARADESLLEDFSLVVIDECHRLSTDENSQYQLVLQHLAEANSKLCILGLTATPYRLGLGWVYEYHYRGELKSQEQRFFHKCIYELTLKEMIRAGYLTEPIKIDAPIACYDFASLKIGKNSDQISAADIKQYLDENYRVTPGIVEHIKKMSETRIGVMLFTATVKHAEEILSLLPAENSALIVGDTPGPIRDEIVNAFKAKKIKYLVNVSVLTTGFDAPHVDLIAVLRPTESVSLYQQIIGRGLRLAPGKKDCLILDYTGLDYDIYSPEVGEKKPSVEAQVVEVVCPRCHFTNEFWGQVDFDGEIVEHYGRKCKGAKEDSRTSQVEPCGFLFRFKTCTACGEENDIAARSCRSCREQLVDFDKKLKDAMALKDAHVMRPDTMLFERSQNKKGMERLEISYYDLDGQALKEYYYLHSSTHVKAFYYHFVQIHDRLPGTPINLNSVADVLKWEKRFRFPRFVIARKKKYFWEIKEKIF